MYNENIFKKLHVVYKLNVKMLINVQDDRKNNVYIKYYLLTTLLTIRYLQN